MILSDIQFALGNLVAAHDSELARRAARLTSLCRLFFECYGDGPVSLMRAPARMGLLGEHIDYVSYLPTASLTFASHERDALMLYRRSNEPVVHCVSSSANYEPETLSILDADVPEFEGEVETEWLGFLSALGTPKPNWRNYIQSGVAFARGQFGKQIRNGFDFALDSNIPPGGGASSSSALVVLGGAAIRNANDISWTASELAQQSAMAEWFIGTRGGSMDHITICLAQAASAVVINYATGQTGLVTLPDEPFEWMTFFTKPADKGREIMIEYNERAAVSRLLIPAIIEGWKSTAPERNTAWLHSLDLVAEDNSDAFFAVRNALMALPETISIETISTSYPDTFAALKRSFPALLQEKSRWPLKIRVRALHHLGEVRRVTQAIQTLQSLQNRNDDTARLSAMQTIGKLLDESHCSLRDLYEVSVPEVEELRKIIHQDSHVLGARVMGGGFGGNVLALTTRQHSQDLINRVQEHYYAPRARDGVREGSVIVSTPGRGLDHVDLDELWRDGIVQINSLGSNAGSHSTNLRALIDVSSRSFDREDIWPVIVAAGKGTRASETGLSVPKPVAKIGAQPAIVHVLLNIQEGLGKTRPPIIIVSPDTEEIIRKTLHGADVLFVTQPNPLGTGDAVFSAYNLMRDFTGSSLIVWGTQPVIRPKTFARAARLARVFELYDMVLPTTFVEYPYAPIQRNEVGAIEAAIETHLETAQPSEFGETNIGLFILRNQTMFHLLAELRSRYWNESTGRYNRSRGELGFPNELISTLAKRESGVFASPFADPREAQGIKRLEDLSHCERFISELEQEETTRETAKWQRP
jgi:galactokinase/NDP-sugar pyrophosphorylase family protein